MFFWHLNWCLVTIGKHSWYVVNPIAIKVHQLSTASLPYHLKVITCVLIQKLTKDMSVPNLLLHKIL